MSFRFKKWNFVILSTLSILILASCIHFEPARRGQLVDSQTHQPVSAAIVFSKIEYICYLPLNPGGPNPELLGINEVLTDHEGRYILPSRFYWLPPRMCHIESQKTYYFKPEYYVEKDKFDDTPDVLLRRAHYLDVLPLLTGSNNPFLLDELVDSSELFSDSIAKLTNDRLTPLDLPGTFVRVPGKRFTRIYGLRFEMDRAFLRGTSGIIAYDENGKEWVGFDSTGKPANDLNFNQEPWEFRGDDQDPIYASRNEIFFRKDDDRWNPGIGIARIRPQYGDISALNGGINLFMTIEGDGKWLCLYRRDLAKREPFPQFVNALKIDDVSGLSADKNAGNARFKLLEGKNTVVIQTPMHWVIFRIEINDSNASDLGWERMNAKELLRFQETDEISAIDGYSNITLAFRNGLRGYYADGYGKLKEFTDFSSNARTVGLDPIRAIASGETRERMHVIYAVDGSDRIYRFDSSGMPDYPIAFQD